MSYTLYGSRTSPFVRRIRILMQGLQYEFKELDIFYGKDAELLNKINPINQIPVLTHGDQSIWDSRIIFNYLNQIHRFQEMCWNDENNLTAIDGAMNAAVSLLLMKRSDININEPRMYIKRQKERIESILNYLKPQIQDAVKSKTWNFQAMSLYCFFDWGVYRELIDLSHRPECLELVEIHKNKPIILETQIPKA